MLHIMRSAVKCFPTKLSSSLLCIQNRIPRQTSLQCSNQFFPKYRKSTRSNLSTLFKTLEKNANLGCISLKDVENAFDKIKETRSVSISQSLMLIRFCGSLMIEEKPEIRIELVQKIWKTFVRLGAEFDISHHNMLLKVYLENEHNFSPSDFLNDLSRKKIEPNRVTYERIIMQYCQMGNIAGAMDILAIMREKDMTLTVDVHHALIIGYSRANDMENAEGILDILVKSGLNPSSETYSLIVRGYIKQGNLEKANDLMKNYESRGIEFSDRDYLNIIYEFAVNNYEYEVDKMLRVMKKSTYYNTKAANLTLQLVTVGKPQVALKITNSMNLSKESLAKERSLERSLIPLLIRYDAPADLILRYCYKLMNTHMNPNALKLAMLHSLCYGKIEIALKLFDAAKKKNLPVRVHYFWPLLICEAKKNNAPGVFRVLSVMCTDFGLTADSETMRYYVIPQLLKQNMDVLSDHFLSNFKSCGIPVGTVASAVVYRLLNDNKIQEAVKVAETYHAYYPPSVFQRRLVSSFLKTRDVDAFTRLLREISTGIQSQWNHPSTNECEENVSSQLSQNFVNYTVKHVLETLTKEDCSLDLITKLLLSLLENKISITKKNAEEINNLLSSHQNHDVSVLLGKLSSNEFSLPVLESKSTEIPLTNLDLKSLERLCETMEAQGECAIEIKKYLFPLYARDKQFDKLFKIKQELEADNVIFTEGMHSYLIDAYVEENKLDDALTLYQLLREKSNFRLDLVKLLRLAERCLQNGHYDKALELLNQNVHIDKKQTAEDDSLSLCKNILDILAEKGDVKKVEEFFDLLVSRKLVTVKNWLLGPLIKVHLQRDDLESAVKQFVFYAQKYHVTPMKHILARTCAEKGDWEKLDRITNISSSIHGDASSLCDLLITFLECGEIERAEEVLKLPVLHLSDSIRNRLVKATEKYFDNGDYKCLQRLLKLTEGTDIIDRRKLYFKILSIYCRSADADRAMELWTQLQDEDFSPSNEFLIVLADILNKKGMPVPFTVPEEYNNELFRKSHKSKVKLSLNNLIQSGNIDEALKLSKKCKPEEWNAADWSLLISGCLRSNRYSEAKELFKEYNCRIGQLSNHGLMAYFLEIAAKAGDVDFVKYCEQFFSDEWMQKASFRNYLAKAYLNTHRAEEYLIDLENTLDRAKTDAELVEFFRTFPRGGIFDILIKKPELYSRIKKLIEKCTDKGDEVRAGQNALWTYLMLKKEFDEADRIWKTHFENRDNVVHFKKLSEYVLENSDTELGTKLMNQLEAKVNTSPGVLGIVYGIMISAYVQKNAIHDALKILDHALTKTTIDKIIISSLYTLKAVCKTKNIPFPYIIPITRFSGKRCRIVRKVHGSAHKTSNVKVVVQLIGLIEKNKY